jgi:hypothetical protein
MHKRRLHANRDLMRVLVNGGSEWTQSVENYRAARKNMEDLEWTGEKREGGGDIKDLLIRACLFRVYLMNASKPL